MVNIRYLNKKGDEINKLCLQEAKTRLSEEMDNGNVVYDEDEKRIVTKATMGKIKADTNIAVLPRIAGG
jgi:molybdopterin converting factor small subunit